VLAGAGLPPGQHGTYATVVFRDPDNNQLEFAAPLTPDAN
jgi:hypothetical protein